MNRKLVIYTCISGNYDVLLQPLAIMPEADYVCFVPRGEKLSGDAGVWRIMEYEAPSKLASINSRYPKMMPHIFLSDYDYSLYVDANIVFTSAGLYGLLEKKMMEGALFSAPAHPFNDCVYDEAALILNTRKDTLWHILKAVHFLKSKGFPGHWGLYENNVILRRHSNPCVLAVDELWWNLFQNYPKRDQLLLTYCLRQHGLPPDYLFPKGVSSGNSEFLSLRKHPSEEKKKAPGFLKRKLSTFPKLILKLYVSL